MPPTRLGLPVCTTMPNMFHDFRKIIRKYIPVSFFMERAFLKVPL
jgi:hypothetical protein